MNICCLFSIWMEPNTIDLVAIWNKASIKIIAPILVNYILSKWPLASMQTKEIIFKNRKEQKDILHEREFVKGIQNEYTIVEHIIHAIRIHETKFEYRNPNSCSMFNSQIKSIQTPKVSNIELIREPTNVMHQCTNSPNFVYCSNAAPIPLCVCSFHSSHWCGHHLAIWLFNSCLFFSVAAVVVVVEFYFWFRHQQYNIWCI